MRTNRIKTMTLVTVCVAAVALAALTIAPALAAEEHTVIPAEKPEWKPGPPTLRPGAQFIVLSGSPAKEGPFVMRIKFPAGFEVPPHHHRKTEEYVTVISGAVGLGVGDKLDRSAAPLLAAGSFVRMPAGMAHFAWTDRETVIQVHGYGPFDVEFVNPDDDPRKKQAGAK